MKCAVTTIKILWGPYYGMYSSISHNFVRCYISISTVLLYTAMYLHLVKKFPLLYLVSSNSIPDPHLHILIFILIFSKQQKCENLTSCIVTCY